MDASAFVRIVCTCLGLFSLCYTERAVATADGESPVATHGAEPWYRCHLVGMEVGPTGAQFGHSDRTDTRYCRRFDGREIVRRCVDAHSEYLVMWVRDGDYAYYDSKLLPKAPGLGDRDPLQETMEEAQKHDLPVIAYCVVQQGGHFLDEHPQYEMRDSQGNRIGRFCYNSGYLEVMKAIVAEQLAYGIAGFHIDMVDQGFGPPYGCWCDQCRKAFQDQYGCAMPEQVTWDRDWDRMLEFRYATSQRFEKALYRHIRKLKPRATVDFNYHGNPPFSWEVGRDHPETYFQSFQGAHKALVYGHIPWSIVLDENVTAETLKRTPVVLLPNAGILSEREVGLLHDYVEGGGNLILTGLTACYDRMGNLADASGLEELTGAGFVAKLDSLDNWVRFKSDSSAGKDEGQLRDGIAANWPFLVKGRC